MPTAPRPSASQPPRRGRRPAQQSASTRATRPSSASRRPAPSSTKRSQATWTTPGARPLRQRIEGASRKALVYTAATPRWILLLAFVALAVGGALLPPAWGVACIAVLIVFLAWLLYLAWPSLDARQRPGRVLVIGLLVGAAVARVILG